MENLKTKYSAVSAIYSETTDQNEPIDIYITKAKRDTPKQWIKNNTHKYLIVFHLLAVNPNYGHSYYIETILENRWIMSKRYTIRKFR